MKEAMKKRLTLGYSIVLIVLAAVFTIMSIMPAVSINTDKYVFPKAFYEGRYTSKMASPAKIDVGFGTVIDIATNWNDMIAVLGIQGDEANIEAKKARIDKMRADEYSEETIQEEQEELAQMQAAFAEYLAKFSEEDIKRIEDKLQNDDTFINLIGAIYGIIGAFASDTEEAFANSSKLGTDTLDITITILGIIFLLCLIGSAMVLPIIIMIKFIIFLIKSLVHLKNDSDKAIDDRMDKFPFTLYTAMMLMFCMMYSLVATGIEIGLAIKGALVILLVVCLLRSVKTILFADTGRIQIIVKQAISLISVFAALMLLLSFVGVDLINEFGDVITTMSAKQYEAEYEALSSSSSDPYAIQKAAEEAVSSSNSMNTAIIATVAILGAILIVVAIINATERFGNKKMKLKTGEFVPYKAMVVLSVFLLVLAIIPTMLAVDSADARDKAFKAGQFKIWYNEYQEEGTVANLNYELLLNVAKEGTQELANLREELGSADGEKAAELEKQIEFGEKIVNAANDEIKAMETRATRPADCITFALIFLVAEYVYLIVSKVFAKNKKDDEASKEAKEPVTVTD